MTGMFTYGPGRVPPPAHLGLPEAVVAGKFDVGMVGHITPARQAKRLYISGVTEETQESELKAFIERLMHERQYASSKPGPVTEKCSVNRDKLYAWIEVRFYLYTP